MTFGIYTSSDDGIKNFPRKNGAKSRTRPRSTATRQSPSGRSFRRPVIVSDELVCNKTQNLNRAMVVGPSVTRCLNKKQPIFFSLSCPKIVQISLNFFKIAQKVAKYLAYFCMTFWHKGLSKKPNLVTPVVAQLVPLTRDPRF